MPRGNACWMGAYLEELHIIPVELFVVIGVFVLAAFVFCFVLSAWVLTFLHCCQNPGSRLRFIFSLSHLPQLGLMG